MFSIKMLMLSEAHAGELPLNRAILPDIWQEKIVPGPDDQS